MSEPKPRDSPHTAQNWVLVARHLDIRSCITLMATCRELYHNLAYALPKWHFTDQFPSQFPPQELFKSVAEDVDFASDIYKDNEAWLIERLFVYARLGLRVDVRLPLLRRLWDDPRRHTTLRVAVTFNSDDDAVTAIRRISCSHGDDNDGGGRGRDHNHTQTTPEGHAANRARTPTLGERSRARGPAVTSWAVGLGSDEDVDQLSRSLAVLAGMTTVDKLEVFVLGLLSRLVVKDVEQLYITVADSYIDRFEITNVHAMSMWCPFPSRWWLKGECRGLDAVYLYGPFRLRDISGLAGVRTIDCGSTYLCDTTSLHDAHSISLTGAMSAPNLSAMKNLRFLELTDGTFKHGGTIDLPQVHEIEVSDVIFQEAIEFYCPNATKVTLTSTQAPSKFVVASHLRYLRIKTGHLPLIKAEEVKDLHAEIVMQAGWCGKLLSADTAAACCAIEDWRQRVTGTLTVTVRARECIVTVKDPPSADTAIGELMHLMADGNGSQNRSQALVTSSTLEGAESAQNPAPTQEVLTPSKWNNMQQLHLKYFHLGGWTVDGVGEVELSECTGRVTVRRAKQVKVDTSCRKLVLTAEECDELEAGNPRVATIAVVRARSFLMHYFGNENVRIGRVDGVHRLGLKGNRLHDTTLEDVAGYGCDVLCMIDVKLHGEQLEVPSAFMWQRTTEERLAMLRRQCGSSKASQ